MVRYQSTRTRVYALVHRVSEVWALLGGLVLMAVVMVNAFSITSDMIMTKPFPGDFELTELGVAIAAFCFLPYCQMTGSNVSADLFTVGASKLQIALMNLLSSTVALAFSALLLWRMSAGLLDYLEYEEITGILSIPIWTAFIPCLVSLALLVITSLASVFDLFEVQKRA